ncbi:MAG: flagellar biosynthetic protein FliO [Lachnospiraceae bacterium]|nr:flagellar biosynthetic protein FliO [Lachnospiraceae bacterium]
MLLSIEDSISSYAQFITVLLLFVFVLGITYLTTRYIAGYQKSMVRSGNMELLESLRISNNKYLQIVRVGERYLIMAVCKDTVTLLAQMKEDELVILEEGKAVSLDFKGLLDKAKKLHSDRNNRKDSLQKISSFLSGQKNNRDTDKGK